MTMEKVHRERVSWRSIVRWRWLLPLFLVAMLLSGLLLSGLLLKRWSSSPEVLTEGGSTTADHGEGATDRSATARPMAAALLFPPDPSPVVAPTPSGDGEAVIEPWRPPLDALVAAGYSGHDPSKAIIELLTAQPGMGDLLLTLLLESTAAQDEQDALTVALASALNPRLSAASGTDVALPAQLQSLWVDRDGTLMLMAELYIVGEERARYFPRLLAGEGILTPWHAIDLAALMEPGYFREPLVPVQRQRWLQLLELCLDETSAEAVAVAAAWTDSPFPPLREIALQTTVASMADRPHVAWDRIGQAPQQHRMAMVESVWEQIDSQRFVEWLDLSADLMLAQEYRGTALLGGFSRVPQLDLQDLIYSRGDEADSEAFRNLVIDASRGALGVDDTFPRRWRGALEWIAVSDPARSVRAHALRVCALSWPVDDEVQFENLIQRSDVDLRSAQIAASILDARGSTGWSHGD